MGFEFEDRTGEVSKNSFGSEYKIISYKNSNDIIVEFNNGYRQKSNYYDFKRGYIKSPYEKRLFGVGYIGEGCFKTSINNKLTIEYKYWSSMITRCYSNKILKRRPKYYNCSVCDEWHNFQNFAKWFNENYYEIDGKVMSLDKDILIKGNKIYSSKTCVFVPKSINSLFVNCTSARGNNVIGVTFRSKTNRYEANCHCEEGRNYLGQYNTELEAFSVYKQFKEQYIKQVADKYKDEIPYKLYSAMYNYKIEITD